MNPLPFIAAAYAVAIIAPAILGFAALARMRRVERRLRAIDPRSARRFGARPQPRGQS